MSVQRTIIGNITDADMLLSSHETKNREDNETSEDTCATVDERHNYCIPTTQTHTKYLAHGAREDSR